MISFGCILWHINQSKLFNAKSSLSYLPNPSARAGYDTRSIFKAKFNRFEFRVFILLD